MIITALKVFGYCILGSIVLEVILFLIGGIIGLLSYFFGGEK